MERLWNPAQPLPTRRQWEARRKQQLKQQQELEVWAGEMTASRFLELYTDPSAHFQDVTRALVCDYRHHALDELLKMFPFQKKSVVEAALKKHKLFLPTAKFLNSRENTMTRKRYVSGMLSTIPLELVKEKAFLSLEAAIEELKNQKELEQAGRLEAARAAGLLQECPCCYGEDNLEEEMVSCEAGHLFCRECVSGAASVVMGEEKTQVVCPGDCEQEFSWRQLELALEPNLLSMLLKKRQAKEVSGAGLEDLVACPFCPYLAIMENKEDKVLVCRNPECGRESCRLCRESNHIPLRCDEVEKTEGARKEIEEQLTQAMIRECWKCSKKFFKEEGCNKMTCQCGAKMCYLCKEKVTDYSHFYGQVRQQMYRVIFLTGAPQLF